MPTDIYELINRAKEDPAFLNIHEKFSKAGIQNWLLEDEKALLFAVGAYHAGDANIVEIGSFEGGSASFLASGIARRGSGKLYCLDPHLGGPPWLGVAPYQRTLSIFEEKLRFCGVDTWISAKVGASAAVASIWPAIPIDAVFIDGDHSFIGALTDYECWAPKLKPGGLLLLDDVDDAVLMELKEFADLLATFRSLNSLATIQGIAVFEKTAVDNWELLDELSAACAARGISRPWDYRRLHGLDLPPSYELSHSWQSDHGLETAYQLCFLARCSPGFYGFSKPTQPNDREVLHTVVRNRGDGSVVELDEHNSYVGMKFRGILCDPEEAKLFAPLLLPGGLLWARQTNDDEIGTRRLLLDAGLEGCGFVSHIQWGIWQPSQLSAEAVMNLTVEAFQANLGAVEKS